jgi:hypothetical protein
MSDRKKHRAGAQRRLDFSSDPQQITQWIWASTEPEGFCPGCGRPLYAFSSADKCCVLHNGRLGAYVFYCASEYHRMRKASSIDVLFLQTVIDEALQELKAQPEGRP